MHTFWRLVTSISLLVFNIEILGFCFAGLSYPSDITCILALFGLLILGCIDYKLIRLFVRHKTNTITQVKENNLE